ncbi:MAG: hypothetical protein JRI88_06090 [Deltaproteobacteria bacterium]|nr:hypothetical protein [Deltaproteobacteria bacterium]
MQTQKIAITVPKDLIAQLDLISRQKGMPRSRLISNLLRKSIAKERAENLKAAYDQVFSDESIKSEQLKTSQWFEKAESGDGQEW